MENAVNDILFQKLGWEEVKECQCDDSCVQFITQAWEEETGYMRGMKEGASILAASELPVLQLTRGT